MEQRIESLPRASVQVRSDLIRERVRDGVTLLGFGDAEYGLGRFARRAVEAANAAGMRVWSQTDHQDEVDGCIGSLVNLLGNRSGATGRSEHWVIDIWELVLDEIYHGRPVKPSATPDPMVELLAGEKEIGVQVFAADPKPKQSFAMRMLDAYMARDDEAILKLALEIEDAENGR